MNTRDAIPQRIPNYDQKYLIGGMLLNKNISIITDPDGKKLVLINDVKFKSRRTLNWTTVEEILKEGTKKAQAVAKETMKKVKKAMMLDYFE